MVRLEKVNTQNVWKLLKLEVTETQRDFVATNTESIVEAYLTLDSGGKVFPFGIFEDDTPVGFVMIGYGTDPSWADPPAIAEGNYNLWRFMVDRRYQNRGIGRAALALALDYIRTKPCGDAEYCYLSYEPENEVAKRLYASFGFTETGELDGDELIAVIKL